MTKMGTFIKCGLGDQLFTVLVLMAPFSDLAWADSREGGAASSLNVVQLRQSLSNLRPTLGSEQEALNHEDHIRLSMPADLLNALEDWLRIARQQLALFAVPDQIAKFKIAGFADHLRQVRYSTLPPSIDRVINQAEDHLFHLEGPVAQWLWDEGLNPKLALWLKSATTEFDGWASALEEHPEKLKNEWAFIPRVQESSSEQGAGGLVDRDFAHKIFFQRAFQLTAEGRPEQFEPGLERVLELAQRMRTMVAFTATDYPSGLLAHFFEYFNGRDKALEWLLGEADILELIAIDLQGINDSLRYKATLAKTPLELFRIEQELGRYLVKRWQFTEKVEQLRQLIVASNEDDFWTFKKNYEGLHLNLNADLKQLRGEIGRTIHLLDQILGVAHDPEKALAQDTPFEIQFILDRQAAEMAGLGQHWESVRTHKYLVREREYTERWTYTVVVSKRDAKGNVTTSTETRTHYRNWTEHDYETVNTPVQEMAYRRELIDFDQQIQRARTSEELLRLKQKGDQILRNIARYAAEEPTGDRDYSDKYQLRNKMLVQMARSLLAKISLKQMQDGSFTAEFRRAPSVASDSVLNALALIQQTNSRMRSIRNYTAGGLAAAGALAGGCWALLVEGGYL